LLYGNEKFAIFEQNLYITTSLITEAIKIGLKIKTYKNLVTVEC